MTATSDRENAYWRLPDTALFALKSRLYQVGEDAAPAGAAT